MRDALWLWDRAFALDTIAELVGVTAGQVHQWVRAHRTYDQRRRMQRNPRPREDCFELGRCVRCGRRVALPCLACLVATHSKKRLATSR
jgi:hypothetical protein